MNPDLDEFLRMTGTGVRHPIGTCVSCGCPIYPDNWKLERHLVWGEIKGGYSTRLVCDDCFWDDRAANIASRHYDLVSSQSGERDPNRWGVSPRYTW